MRVYIHADMEGIAGINLEAQVKVGGDRYEEGRRLLARECNWVTDACFRHGASAVTVSDTHFGGGNLTAEVLDPRASLSLPRWPYLLSNIDEDYDVMFLIGHHAMAGTLYGFLEHSFSSGAIHRITMDGRPVGEIGIESLFAAAFGVPTGLVSGDAATAAETETELPRAERVILKHARMRNRCSCLPFDETDRLFDEAVERVLKNPLPKADPVEWPKSMAITYHKTDFADEFMSRHPQAERIDGCTVSWRAERPEQLVQP